MGPKKTESKTKTPKKAETKLKKDSVVVGKKKPAVKKGGKAETKKLTYLQMVTDAITTMKDRSGSSRKAILKHIIDTHKIEEAKVVHIRKAIAMGLEKGLLKQARPTGKGAGSFRVVKKEEPKAKKPTVKKIVKASSAGASSTKKNLHKKTIKTVKSTTKGKDKKVAPKKIATKGGAKTIDKKSAAKPAKVAAKKEPVKKSEAGKKTVNSAAGAGKKTKK